MGEVPPDAEEVGSRSATDIYITRTNVADKGADFVFKVGIQVQQPDTPEQPIGEHDA